MATIKLIPSAYTLSSTTYLTISNADNMYTDTSSTTYAQITHNRNSSTAYYLYIHGFDFDSIPSGATVSSFSIKIRALESALSTSSSYRMSLYNNTTSLSNTTVSSSLSTSATTFTFPNGSLTWSTLSGYGNDFRIRVPLRRNSSSTSGYVRIYGAEIEVTYTAANVPVTGVTLNKSTDSIEVGSTTQLTATVAPSNATNQAVSWSSNNTSVATVDSTGLVTGVSAGTATITVTTSDGNKTATCAVTVTQPVLKTYKLATSVTPGKSYLIANGNSGSVYLLSNEANGSRKLKGVSTTVTNGKISISSAVEAKTLFSVNLTVSGNSVTTGWSINGQYLYCDNASGLRMNTVSSLDRFWHWNNNKFWQFKNTSSDGYSDTSSEYKYYLTLSGTDFTDSHVDTTSIENSSIPEIYLFEEDTGSSSTAYVKVNGSWVAATAVYKKVNGSWVEQTDFTSVFSSGVNYKTDLNVLYKLSQETTFNGTSDYIDTGIQLLLEQKDFTIVADYYKSTTNLSTQPTVFHVMHESSPYPGINIDYPPTGSTPRMAFGTSSFTGGSGNNSQKRTKVIITYNTTTGYFTGYFKVDGLSVASNTYNYNPFGISESLILGAYQDTSGTKGRFFDGTIYDFKIYERIFTQTEINEYLGVS